VVGSGPHRSQIRGKRSSPSSGTRTETYSEAVYNTYTIPGSVTFVPVGDADLTNLEVNGESLDPITIDGQSGYAYYNNPQTVEVQTGTRTVTTTVPVISSYLVETQGFTDYNITGDGGSDSISANAPFVGTVVTGDGNDVSVALGMADSYWLTFLGHAHYYYRIPSLPARLSMWVTGSTTP